MKTVARKSNVTRLRPASRPKLNPVRSHGTLTAGATVGGMFHRIRRGCAWAALKRKLDREDPGYAV